MSTGSELIERFGLRPHPIENGYMSDVTYQSSKTVTVNKHDSTGDRNFTTSLADTVYFLYERGQFSPWHRMKTSDELWIHQRGASMNIFIIDEQKRVDGACEIETLTLQPCGIAKITAGCWFATELSPGGEDNFCLSTVLLCPGFSPTDFELATPEKIISVLKDADAIEMAKKYFNK